ncbi:unnamed protein product [Orchesella dallaii]|uniref:non-specific serine/threonine protein kinase n=1 Tax=Orchesella dallaii TaxID=48710 RepID=A0ABP1RRI5_9HEXA
MRPSLACSIRDGPILVGDQYQLVTKLGKGSFSEVWLGNNINNGEEVALKTERVGTPFPNLRFENEVYQSFAGGTGIPKVFWYGELNNQGILYNVMALERLGPSLNNLLDRCDGTFSLKTTLMLADQMLECIEFVHDNNFIHRDIKLDNFLMGAGANRSKLYLIDFGLALRYRDPSTGIHVDFSRGKFFMGTALFASLNAHLGFSQGRRDDLESIGYVLVSILSGSLPWSKAKGLRREQVCDKVKASKITTSMDKLCKGLPPVFKKYFEYCLNLKYEELPNYTHLREIFRKLFRKRGYRNDYVYDWDLGVDKNGMAVKKIPRTEKKSACVIT